MSFGDIFKESFLKSIDTGDISFKIVCFTICMSCIFAVYIFFVYRFLTRKTFYDKNFNISLAAITVITTAIIITIQSSLVVSLGMVGALSIVRFRTAIKNPLDLVFLFWAIAMGIICGSGLTGIGIITSVILTAGIYLLDLIPVARSPKILIIYANDRSVRQDIINNIKKNAKYYTIKSETMEMERLSIIVEVRSNNDEELIDNINEIKGIRRCSLLNHDGEVTF